MEKTKKVKTLAVVRTVEKQGNDGTYEVTENLVDFKICQHASDFKAAMVIFRGVVSCVFPLKNSWVGSATGGDYEPMPVITGWSSLVKFFVEMGARMPANPEYRPDICINTDDVGKVNFVSYTTGGKMAHIFAKKNDDGTFAMGGWTWHDNRKISPLLNALKERMAQARIRREEVPMAVEV